MKTPESKYEEVNEAFLADNGKTTNSWIIDLIQLHMLDLSLKKVWQDVMPILLLSKAIATIGFTIKTKTWDNKNKDLYMRHLQLLEKILE